MKKYLNLFLGLSLGMVFFNACKKKLSDESPVNPATSQGFNYGDSVFYLRSSAYTISPANPRTGTYTAFPENLLINNTTGQITVTITGKGEESQTGMKYRIMFEEAGTGKRDSTYITIAGINYIDRIYYLSRNDSIIRPIYNNNTSLPVPGGIYGIQADNDLAIDPANGEINIKECIRRGLFNRPAENGEWEELTVNYKSSDNSSNASNRIDIALYYYNTIADVPSNISVAMRAHQSMMLGVAQPEIPLTTGPFEPDLPDNLSLARPRPPCVIIIAN